MSKTIFTSSTMRVLFPALAASLGRFQTSCPLPLANPRRQYDQQRPISPTFWKYVDLLQIWVDQILILKSHCELECLGARKGDKARYHLLEDEIIHFHQLVSLSYLLPSKFLVSLSSYLPKSGKMGGVHFWGQTNWRKISQKKCVNQDKNMSRKKCGNHENVEFSM